MTEAVSRLNSGDRDAAAEQMKRAVAGLTADTEELLKLMEQLSVILMPAGEGTETPPTVQLLLDALALASDQKVLYRKTQAATPKQAAGFATKQRALAKRVESLVKRSQSLPNPVAETEAQTALYALATKSTTNLVAAKQHMLEAAAKLESSAQAEAITGQHEAGEVLRHFILDYVLAYVVPPGPVPPEPSSPTDPVGSFGDDFTLFSPGAVSGGKPKGGRQEWQVLGRRDRAALNENFARELPLEYRAILKDYYERLAK
jgi:hypothetical protein